MAYKCAHTACGGVTKTTSTMNKPDGTIERYRKCLRCGVSRKSIELWSKAYEARCLQPSTAVYSESNPDVKTQAQRTHDAPQSTAVIATINTVDAPQVAFVEPTVAERRATMQEIYGDGFDEAQFQAWLVKQGIAQVTPEVTPEQPSTLDEDEFMCPPCDEWGYEINPETGERV